MSGTGIPVPTIPTPNIPIVPKPKPILPPQTMPPTVPPMTPPDKDPKLLPPSKFPQPTTPGQPGQGQPNTPQTPPDAPGTTGEPQAGPSANPGRPGALGPLGAPLARGGNPVTQFVVQQLSPGHSVRVWRQSDGREYRSLSKDVLSISTDSIVDSTGFEFTFTLLPTRFKVGEEENDRAISWAELLRPMDYIEISLAEEVARYLETPQAILQALVNNERGWPRVLIRGFITSIKMVETVEPRTGQPQRRVVCSGMNFGKLWQNYKMFTIIEEQSPQSVYAKYANLFPPVTSPGDFLKVVFDKIFVPQRKDLEKIFPAVKKHQVDCSVPGLPKYGIGQAENALTNFSGSLDNLVRKYSVTPYTEFFTYDEPFPSETGGHSITTWRWSPYTNRSNQFPLPEHVKFGKPHVWTLHAFEITQFEVGTSDLPDVYTYYWAGPTQATGAGGNMSLYKLQAPGYLDRPAFGIYGWRPLEPGFTMYGALRGADPFASTVIPDLAPQIEELTNWLAAVNENNANNWEGQLECNGRPDIKCGDFLDIPEAGLRFYIQGVHHNYTFPDRFTTRIDVSRGIPIDGDLNFVLPLGYFFNPNVIDPEFPDVNPIDDPQAPPSTTPVGANGSS